ncbi:MAG TPA: DEAD/DEAH box helicase [Acidimicrobiales bacterium]|nr:DEAD/DEAH box helicase [Acidimicrobiales bacterium]
MARAREASDWGQDLRAARAVEGQVARALAAHPTISHLADYTTEMDGLDFEFRFDGDRVRVDVKEKRQRYSSEIAEMWPDVPGSELFVLDETCLRALLWAEGLGYLIVKDVPARRWHILGPWELCLGPRRRFERRGDRGAGPFLKGKLLVDLRTAAETTPDLSIDALLRVVRTSRRALRQVEAFTVRGRSGLPVIPRDGTPADRGAAANQHPTIPAAKADAAPDGTEAFVDPLWNGLDPELVTAIKAKWGWDAPTAVQALAFPHVLAGANVLVLAPTAGGKTEAALLPLLDVLRRGGWQAPSVLAISPLKALLDDQLVRYRRAAALTGATVFAWHGDVGRHERKAFRDKPTDILLTTPESLESLLSRPTGDKVHLLSRLRVVVIDEVHAFSGTPRGAQLAALVERLEQRTDNDIQRIGLSATVGNPEGVSAWLGGGSQRVAAVVQVDRPMNGEQIAISSYETPAEASGLIGEAVGGKRALVFAPSRRRAEELANGLGVAVHHSSVSADERLRAVQRLTEDPAGCIVATSSLEMGIDVGDIELVVNDGAPSGPGAYLQRLGRGGRRNGNPRMLLTVGDPDSLLLVLAVVTRARRRALDPVPPGRGARLVLAQQAMALAFERTSFSAGDLHEYLRWSPLFAPLAGALDATIAHLLSQGFLAAVGTQLVVGPVAQNRFGGRGFVDLLATFQTTAGACVVDTGGRQIGTLDWDQVTDASGDPRSGGLVLGGKGWTVASVDQAAGTVVVVPAGGGRAPSWRGPALEVGRATWETAREILAATDVPVTADDRSLRWLEGLRRSWAPRLAEPVRAEEDATVVDAFAGAGVHRAVLGALGFEGSVDGPSCRIHAPRHAVAVAAQAAIATWEEVVGAEAVRQARVLAVRHRDLVAPSVLHDEAREYHVDAEGIRGTLSLLSRSA